MPIESYQWLFILLLFIVAFLYSSVGHGGASGYLALMAIAGVAPSIIRPSALLLNIFVSFISFIYYLRGGYFKWKLFLPFALLSVPASFAGALIVLDTLVYKRILGVLLFFPILRLSGLLGKDIETIKNQNIYYSLIIGAVIGFLSGMIGIGGGIILSPVILLLHWGKMKETAAVSALFIFVNSVSGFIGLKSENVFSDNSIYLWVGVALAGGIAGSYFGSNKFNSPVLKKIVSLVLLIACVKLLTL